MSEKLPNRLVEALDELRRYTEVRKGLIWWYRQASMRVLAEKGYVYAWHPEGKQVKVMAYKLTDRGREFLSGFPASGASS